MPAPHINRLVLRPSFNAVAPSNDGPVLDSLSMVPAAAYSTRKLRTAYTGPALRVRRSSDNAEQDFGFDGAGNLDTAALLAFVGAGNGFVATWYDQTGNGRHLTKTVIQRQPDVVASGVLNTTGNGRPCLIFDAITGELDEINMATVGLETSNNVGALGVNVVARTIVPTSGLPLFRWSTNSNTTIDRFALYRNTSGNQFIFGRRLDADSASQINGTAFKYNASDFFVDTGIANYQTREVWYYLNGNLSGSSTTAFSGAGTTSASNSAFVGIPISTAGVREYAELVLFNTLLSTADRQTLERNQGQYFGLTVA